MIYQTEKSLERLRKAQGGGEELLVGNKTRKNKSWKVWESETKQHKNVRRFDAKDVSKMLWKRLHETCHITFFNENLFTAFRSYILTEIQKSRYIDR